MKLVAAVALVEPGLGLVGAQGRRLVGTSLVRGERAGGVGQPGPAAVVGGLLLVPGMALSLSPVDRNDTFLSL